MNLGSATTECRQVNFRRSSIEVALLIKLKHHKCCWAVLCTVVDGSIYEIQRKTSS